MSLVGWIHFTAASLSMLFGAVILFSAKGTASHLKQGRRYVCAMVVTNVTALMIYRNDSFFFPHWLAIATLVVVVTGYWVVSAKPILSRLPVHIACMVVSYYMLAGGAVNEAFLRIGSLKPYIEPFPNPLGGTVHPVLGMVHSILILVFMIVLVVFVARRQKLLSRSSD